MKLASNSPNVTITDSNSTYITQNGPGGGLVRFNTSNQTLEAFDGYVWHDAQPAVTIGLSASAEDAINWAREKMIEERELKEKMKKFPALKDAYDKFKMVEALVHEEGSGDKG